MQYLKAVKAVGSTDSDKVMAEMKKMKINDMFTKGGYIRADGLMVHTMYVMQVKTPAESKYPWDYYKIVKVLTGEEAYGPQPGMQSCPSDQEVRRQAHRAPVLTRDRPFSAVPLPAILGQLMLGLVNGSFYAMLSLGLAVIFGLLGVVNFAHGAFYMLGAFAAYIGLAIVRHQLLVARCFSHRWRWALLGIVIERLLLRHCTARSAVRPVADVRPGADRRRRDAQSVRLLGQVVSGARRAAGRSQSRLHDAADLPRLGHRRLADGVLTSRGSSSSARAWAHACARRPRTRKLVQAFGINVPLHRDVHLRRRRGARRAGRRAAAPVIQVSR